jgi:hypothetical protein
MTLPARDPAALASLEDLQRDAAANFAPDWGGPLSEEDELDAAREAIERGYYPPGTTPEMVRDRIRGLLTVTEPERWSSLEPHSHRFYLARAEEHVLRGLEARGTQIPVSAPAFGTLPTHDFNARVWPVPGTDARVVAFDSGILELTSTWATIVSACLRGHQSEAVTMLFIDMVFSQVVLGSGAFLHRSEYGIDNAVMLYGEATIRPQVEAFLLAHEYGHIMLGHPPSTDEEPQAENHRRELEADGYGLETVLAAFQDPVPVYVGVQSLLCAFSLFERGCNLLEHDRSPARPTATHPAAVTRRAALVEIGLDGLDAQQAAEAIHWGRVVEDETLRLWLPLEKALWHAADRFPAESRPGWPPDPFEKREALRRFFALIAETADR